MWCFVIQVEYGIFKVDSESKTVKLSLRAAEVSVRNCCRNLFLMVDKTGNIFWSPSNHEVARRYRDGGPFEMRACEELVAWVCKRSISRWPHSYFPADLSECLSFVLITGIKHLWTSVSFRSITCYIVGQKWGPGTKLLTSSQGGTWS